MYAHQMSKKDAGMIISALWSGKIPANDDRVPQACKIMNIPLEKVAELQTEMKKVEKTHCRVEIITPAGCRR